MSCVYNVEELSFPCIMEIVSDIRSKDITVLTFRKVLKQLDSGLAKFGDREDSIIFTADKPIEDQITYICKELEAIYNNEGERAEVGNLNANAGNTLVMLLKALLKLLLETYL